MSRTRQDEKETLLKEKKMMLQNTISCINDILNGIPEDKACKNHNIQKSAFRHAIFYTQYGNNNEQSASEIAEQLDSKFDCLLSPYERLYCDTFDIHSYTTIPPYVDEIMNCVINNINLSSRQKAYIHYRYEEEMTLEQIANRYFVTRESVRVMISSAQRKIRRWKTIFIGGPEVIAILEKNRVSTNIIKQNELYADAHKLVIDYTKMHNEKMLQSLQSLINDVCGTKMSPDTISVMNDRIVDCDISTRLRNILRRYEIVTFADLLKYSEPDIAHFRNMGRATMNEIKALLDARGLKLK